jgi:hypothetical protein
LENVDQLELHYEFENLNYRSQIQNSYLNFQRDERIHSGVKPFLFPDLDGDFNRSKFKVNYQKMKGTRWINLYPIADIVGGIELNNSIDPLLKGGIGVGFDLSTPKFVLTAKALPYYSQTGVFGDSLHSKYKMDFGTNRSLANDVFYNAELLVGFHANKFFTLIGGYGKNFFGEGYRSLLLSDNIGAHPFFKIETSFSSVKYVNLYSFWKNNSVDPFDQSQDVSKFNSTHYVSWNVTKDFNLSIFETVIFQNKDTLVNRGFDFNYINPIVLFRPVEYGLGSSDNVLMGMNMSYKINDHHNVYAQFVLDEFLLSEIKYQSKWWANKYGWQVGYKSDAFFRDSLYFQVEFNGVRPFTYSHLSSNHSYGHMNAAAAHPIGANFMELLQITSFSFSKHRITNKITFASYGTDPADTVSYGTDIFKSYTLRTGNFDQLLFQGIRTNVLNETFIYEFELFPEIDMFLLAQYNWKMVNTAISTNHFHSFSIGIRSRIWNSYNDY